MNRCRHPSRPDRRAGRARCRRGRSSTPEHGHSRRPSPGGASPTRSATSRTSTGRPRWRISEPDRFSAHRRRTDGCPRRRRRRRCHGHATLGDYRAMCPAELLQAWRTQPQASCPRPPPASADDDRVIWYGPSMGSKSFLDGAADGGLGPRTGHHRRPRAGRRERTERPNTDRLQHIAQLGFITHKWSYINRQIDAPSTPVHVSLTAPSGTIWDVRAERCQRLDHRRPPSISVSSSRSDVTSTTPHSSVEGDVALDWMHKAQAFAGGATDGPTSGTFPTGLQHDDHHTDARRLRTERRATTDSFRGRTVQPRTTACRSHRRWTTPRSGRTTCSTSSLAHGYLGITIPEEYGGQGLGLFEAGPHLPGDGQVQRVGDADVGAPTTTCAPTTSCATPTTTSSSATCPACATARSSVRSV